jgi:NAD-dependent deacetylase
MMNSQHMTDSIEYLARLLSASNRAIAFTGAGISTESGIPDFRSPGGVWQKYQPVYFADFLAHAAARAEYWRQKSESHREFADSRPNQGHTVLAKWEQTKRICGVITQNIDELHQAAGSSRVLELHGTAKKVACLDCGYRDEADSYVNWYLTNRSVPPCPECGGLLKHATVSFGQSLSADVLDQAESWCRAADLVLAIGSSLVVTPAADLPRLAQAHGATLVIINRDPTPLDSLAEVIIHEPIGDTLLSVDQLIARASEC